MQKSMMSILGRDQRGAVTLEYVILIGTVALGSVAAFVAFGAVFVRSFLFIRYLLLCPFP